MSESPWIIRPYRPGDEVALVALFERVFGRPLSPAHWHWKLKQQPGPVENVWVAAARTTDQPIFQYAGIPTRYRVPGGEQTAIVSVDTMASPDYRRQGLLTTVGSFTYQRWQEAGIPFVIGLPNEQWGSRAQALGWQPLFPLQWLHRPLRPAALFAQRLHLPLLARLSIFDRLWNRLWRPANDEVTIRPVDHAGAAFDRLWERCAGDYTMSVVRDSVWVSWRYLAAPGFGYRVLLAERQGRPVGYLVCRVETSAQRTVGFIAELFTARDDHTAQRQLLAKAVRHLYQAGAHTVVTLAVPGTQLQQAFRRAGFLFRGHSFIVQLVPLDADLPLTLLKEPQNWHLMGGDFDVI